MRRAFAALKVRTFSLVRTTIRLEKVPLRMRRLIYLFARPWRILFQEGPRQFVGRAFGRISRLLIGSPEHLLVDPRDAMAVDWTERQKRFDERVIVGHEPAEIAWISSPPGPESGGHQNLFRFVKFAEEAGHRSTIYLYDRSGHSISDVRAMVRYSAAYPDLAARIVPYDPRSGVAPDTDAIFATGWETAYPAFRDESNARRLYFVQDFEPSFYPVGSQSLLAENTYRFGFFGITAGRWLADKLARDYGMRTAHFDFAVDHSMYHVVNEEPRREVFFYARPVTPRRAFEFGVYALADFAAMRPDVTINFAGWNVGGFDLPFRYRNLASLPITELNALYNRCAAALVLSLTNLSLLPLELMAAGTVPVINDAPNNRLVVDNEFIEWTPPSPAAIARRLTEVIDRRDGVERSRAMSAFTDKYEWAESGKQFLAAFEGAMRG